MKEIPKRYNPEQYEEKWVNFWVENKIFSSVPDSRTPFSIVIPPPNVTGVLHMGHALNNVLQDIIIRFRKITGYNTMWMPGTDHGGIATQNVVEKLLLDEGKTRHELGREEFEKRMWQWKDESGGTIIKQLIRLGCGCDWDRIRFTMDEQCSRAVNEAFIRLFKKGLIYRGKYMINWCPRCGTALSDIEVEHRETISKLWYIRYPIVGEKDKYVVVATTRPETMLGDTAVAVNPKDDRYKNILNKKIRLPVINRELKVIEDNFVDPEFGTGIVKVTPAHDPNDFDMGKRHGLDSVKVIDENGTMTEKAEEYAGQDRFECRKNLVKRLKKENLIEKIEDYTHSIGECYRCSSVVEPLLSKQWFLKMRELSDKAIQASQQKKIEFIPERWEKPYINWLENIHDWCISRQIWWGHRIPIYHCEDHPECPPIAAKQKPDQCPNCSGTNIVQDEDVLDTWFSSALWPFSTLGWPQENKELDYYYPTQVLVTGHEILYLWVARMVMMGLEMMGEIPFEKVNIHGMIRDAKGNKMSKSKGNVIDPIDIINKYGTDALRFSLAKCSVPGRDIQLSDDDFISARNFCNKIWNASRLILSNLDIEKASELNEEELELADKWILYETEKFAQDIKQSYIEMNTANTARLVYDFTWKYFCDWYLELAKLRLYKDEKQETVQNVLVNVLIRMLNFIYPIMPFIASQIWQYIQDEVGLEVTHPIYYDGFDKKEWIDFKYQAEKMEKIMSIVNGIRNIRGEINIQPSEKLSVKIKASGESKENIEENISYIIHLAKLEEAEVGTDVQKESGDAVHIERDVSVFVSVPEEMRKREIQRLEKKIGEVREKVKYSNRKLRNQDFVEKAPKEVVDKAKGQVAKNIEELKKLESNLEEIKK